MSRVPPIWFQDVVLECSAGLFALPAVARRAGSEGKIISCALLLSPSNAPRPRPRGSGVLAMASSSCSASSLNELVTVVRIIGLHPKLGEPNAACWGVRGTHIPCYAEHVCVCVAKQTHDCHGDARGSWSLFAWGLLARCLRECSMVVSVLAQPHTRSSLHYVALSRSVRARRLTPSRWKCRARGAPASAFDQDLGSFGHDVRRSSVCS